jgi:hypothetical protein
VKRLGFKGRLALPKEPTTAADFRAEYCKVLRALAETAAERDTARTSLDDAVRELGVEMAAHERTRAQLHTAARDLRTLATWFGEPEASRADYASVAAYARVSADAAERTALGPELAGAIKTLEAEWGVGAGTRGAGAKERP